MSLVQSLSTVIASVLPWTITQGADAPEAYVPGPLTDYEEDPFLIAQRAFSQESCAVNGRIYIPPRCALPPDHSEILELTPARVPGVVLQIQNDKLMLKHAFKGTVEDGASSEIAHLAKSFRFSPAGKMVTAQAIAEDLPRIAHALRAAVEKSIDLRRLPLELVNQLDGSAVIGSIQEILKRNRTTLDYHAIKMIVAMRVLEQHENVLVAAHMLEEGADKSDTKVYNLAQEAKFWLRANSLANLQKTRQSINTMLHMKQIKPIVIDEFADVKYFQATNISDKSISQDKEPDPFLTEQQLATILFYIQGDVQDKDNSGSEVSEFWVNDRESLAIVPTVINDYPDSYTVTDLKGRKKFTVRRVKAGSNDLTPLLFGLHHLKKIHLVYHTYSTVKQADPRDKSFVWLVEEVLPLTFADIDLSTPDDIKAIIYGAVLGLRELGEHRAVPKDVQVEDMRGVEVSSGRRGRVFKIGRLKNLSFYRKCEVKELENQQHAVLDNFALALDPLVPPGFRKNKNYEKIMGLMRHNSGHCFRERCNEILRSQYLSTVYSDQLERDTIIQNPS